MSTCLTSLHSETGWDGVLKKFLESINDAPGVELTYTLLSPEYKAEMARLRASVDTLTAEVCCPVLHGNTSKIPNVFSQRDRYRSESRAQGAGTQLAVSSAAAPTDKRSLSDNKSASAPVSAPRIAEPTYSNNNTERPSLAPAFDR